jgi:arylsulfatase A-like enzyme
LREAKGTMWEGGCRVPCILRWPGRIRAGAVCSEMAATIDLLPTIARLIGAALPPRPIDGRDIGPLILGVPGTGTPRDTWYYWYGKELRAVRSGRWKLVFPHKYQTLGSGQGGSGGLPGRYEQTTCGLELYDLETDPGETRDLAGERDDVVSRLKLLADEARDALGDSLTGRVGREVRSAGSVGP